MKPGGVICLPVISTSRRGPRRQPLTESISKRMRMDMHIFIPIMDVMAIRFIVVLSFLNGWG